MGLVVIAEPIGYIIYLTLAGGVFEHEIVGYYFVVFVMEVFLLLVVELFCQRCVLFSLDRDRRRNHVGRYHDFMYVRYF